MKLFLSTYYNKVDGKGRVSVPASFRSVLENEGFTGLIINKSVLNRCAEASSLERMEQLHENINAMESISSEIRDAFSTFLLGNSIHLLFDSEGRIMIPKRLLEEIGIEDKAVFVGKGKIFEIWNPEAFEEYREKIIKIVYEEKNKLFFDNKKNEVNHGPTL